MLSRLLSVSLQRWASAGYLGCSLTQCLSLREIGYSGEELTEVSAALEVVKNEPRYGNSRLTKSVVISWRAST